MAGRILPALLMIVSMWILPCVTAVHGAAKPKLWSKLCASCHDGNTAPGPEDFRAAYKTVDEFTAAVRAKGSQCMNIVRNDEKMIRKIAAEIGIGKGKK